MPIFEAFLQPEDLPRLGRIGGARGPYPTAGGRKELSPLSGTPPMMGLSRPAHRVGLDGTPPSPLTRIGVGLPALRVIDWAYCPPSVATYDGGTASRTVIR